VDPDADPGYQNDADLCGSGCVSGSTTLDYIYDCKNSLPSTSKILATEQMPLNPNGRVGCSLPGCFLYFMVAWVQNTFDLRSFLYLDVSASESEHAGTDGC
jgi:hypothetical protein